MQETPTEDQLRDAVAAGRKAADNAEAIRLRERRHTRLNRKYAIADGLEECAAAAATLRRYIGMVFAHEITSDAELVMKRTLKDLARQKAKLHRMRR